MRGPVTVPSAAVLLTAVLLVLVPPASSQRLSEPDRARLAEAFRLADAVGERLAEWGAVPFAVVLVAGEDEFLIGHPVPPADAVLVDAFDALVGSPVYARPRRHPPTLLATFPLDGVPTVVVGTPEATGLTSTDWVLTLVHEHVHQVQMGSPGYYDAAAALGLEGGDTSGMWMLAYPFPYGDPEVGTRFARYQAALAAALGAPPAGAEAALAAVTAARARLGDALGPADARYLSFQTWQEGVARYVQGRAAEVGAEAGAPVAAYRALPDAVPYAAAADTLRARRARGLAAGLAEAGRLAFYSAGDAHARVLDAARPGWRRRYLLEPFALERYAE